MKKLLILILGSMCTVSYGQTAMEKTISRIEKGLTEAVVSFDTTKIKKMSLADRMRHYKVNGLSIAVIQDGTIQWAKGYGVADASTGERVTTETVFQTASIGKVVTGLAALKLVKEGKITLDQNVNEKLTSWKVPDNEFTVKEKVTLRRLLCHSAGFTDDYGFEGYGGRDSVPALIDILKAEAPAKNTKPLVVHYIPGTQLRYSGGSYLIVQQLIEDITGMSFAAYVQQEIFTPLHLKSTYAYHPDRITGLTFARGHDEDGRIDTKDKYRMYPESAAAGFWTTPSDLARIAMEMQQELKGLSDTILDRQLITTMLTAQSKQEYRGLGVALKGAEQADGFWHAGQNAGYNALMYATTANGQGAVVMLNSDADIELAVEIVRSIANEYHWPFMKTQLAETDTLQIMDDIAGTYTHKETGLVWKISRKGNGLKVQYREGNKSKFGPAFDLYRIAPAKYIIREEPDVMNFRFSVDNGIKKFIFTKYGGDEMVMVGE